MDQKITQHLLKYQINHVNKLINILQNNVGCAGDFSDTGVGKTYTTVAICKALKLFPIIICPRSIITNWNQVCDLFKVKNRIIVNYETIKLGKYYVKGQRQKCPYITHEKKITNDLNAKYYQWKNLPDNAIFIYDEAHRCSMSSQNCQLLLASKRADKKIMLLSATIADTPEKFRIFAYVLNFIEPEQVVENKLNLSNYLRIVDEWFIRDPKPMIRLYRMLYPNRASRIRIEDLGDMFPPTQIIAQAYNIGHKREQEIEEQYSIIADQLDKLREKKNKDKTNRLLLILRAQQQIELIKIPLFVELANDFISNKLSVVIFVNFTQSLKTLAKMLNTKCMVYGEQTILERELNIENFQTNKSNIIICNIKAGSVGLSLHDIYGGHQRASLISPTWNSTDLKQSLGRIHRAQAKSKSIQRIVYVANTVEEKICDKIKDKFINLEAINNGDLDLTNIEFKKATNK